MLYLSDILSDPYTGILKTVENESTVFSKVFDHGMPYKWTFSRGLNEENGNVITKFSRDDMVIIFNGILENLEKRYVKISFDFRVRLNNGTDFSIATSNISSTNNHIIINKKLKIKSTIDKFVFQPYKDVIYVLVKFNDNTLSDNVKPLSMKVESIGFGVCNKNTNFQ